MKQSSRQVGLLVAAAFSSNVLAITPCISEDFSAVPTRYSIDYSEIQAIYGARCSGCHIGGASGGLSLATMVSFANTVNVNSSNANAASVRVRPFDPVNSFLFKKVNCTNVNSIAGMPFGLRMPRNGPPFLSLQNQALLFDWISLGAPVTASDRLFISRFDGRF